jgi:aminodeoxychorismate synthase component I
MARCAEQNRKEAPFPISTLHEKPFLPVIASTRRYQKGFVWLESSHGTPGGMSFVATEPEMIMEGAAADWHLIERELAARKRPAVTSGAPDGAAIGYFRFDGSFCFGFYDQLEIENCPVSPSEPPSSQSTLPALDFQSDIGSQEYFRMVRRAQEYIAAGDIYQVCLAHRFSAAFHGDPWPLYLKLRETSPAPYSAYLSLRNETILSSSPECFLKISGRKISTRPIKGTRPRRLDRTEDEREARELRSSPKEIAELIMITDLERNDLGSVCEFGSVTAPRLTELESYAQVFHLVSTVEGTLREEVSHVAAVAACFPGGSISGAPKKRALEIIRELEPTSRGLFTGAIGYFGYNGESQFNIAIRTLIVGNGEAEFHVGAGITADSDPEKEWEETLHKAAGILAASRNC